LPNRLGVPLRLPPPDVAAGLISEYPDLKDVIGFCCLRRLTRRDLGAFSLPHSRVLEWASESDRSLSSFHLVCVFFYFPVSPYYWG